MKDIKLIKRYLTYFKPYRDKLILMELIVLISIVIGTIQPLIWGKIVVSLFEGNSRIFYIYTACTILIFLINAMIDFVHSYVSANIEESVKIDIKKYICDRVLKLPMKTINAMNLGEVYIRLEHDTSTVMSGILDTIFTLTNSIIRIVVIGVVILKMNVVLALIILMGTPVMAFFVIKYGEFIRRLNKESLDIQDRYSDLVQQLVYGLREIRAMRADDIIGDKYYENAKAVKEKNMQIIMYENIYGIAGSALNFAMDTLILLIGGIMILNGSLAYEFYVAFASYASQFSTAYKSFLNNNVTLQTTVTSIERLDELIESENRDKQEIRDKKNIAGCMGDILFDNVSFGYNETGYVLKNVSFRIKKNTTVGIIGSNGSGKSTILNLILNLYDVDEGNVFIGDVNVKKIPDNVMRRSIFPVMQDGFLFNMSIKENFLLIKPDATDDEIRAACKQAHIDDFIETLPGKYNSGIGENGVSMSGGQRQRLLLARCILKEPDVLLLDEATASVDRESVQYIKELIKVLSENHTIIVVTHDENMFDIFDQVICLENGEVVDRY